MSEETHFFLEPRKHTLTERKMHCCILALTHPITCEQPFPHLSAMCVLSLFRLCSASTSNIASQLAINGVKVLLRSTTAELYCCFFAFQWDSKVLICGMFA